MIGCIPKTIPVKRGNPDESIHTVKSVGEAKKIVETVKKNSRRFNRAKKTDEAE